MTETNRGAFHYRVGTVVARSVGPGKQIYPLYDLFGGKPTTKDTGLYAEKATSLDLVVSGRVGTRHKFTHYC